MFDDPDQELGPVLTLVIGLAIVVCLFTIGVALSVAGAFSPPVQAAASTDTASTAIRIHFPVGSSDLPAEATNELFTVIVAATVDGKRRIELSGHHDASGDRARNLELAKARAIAVRDVLRAAGVADGRIVLVKPVEVVGGGDPAEARRVDVRLR